MVENEPSSSSEENPSPPNAEVPGIEVQGAATSVPVGIDPPILPVAILPASLPPWQATTSSEPRNLAETLEQIFGKEAYGAPRVFDLFTLLAVTLAFALLFGSIRLAEPVLILDTGSTILAMSAFFTGIAVGQLMLWSGSLPRLASIVMGPALWISIGIGLWLSGHIGLKEAILGALCTSPFALFFGYLGGTVVAGVFLVADAFRTKFLVRADKPDREIGFDQLD